MKKPLIVTTPFKRHKSNYTLANKLPPNISAFMTFWSGDVKICCTASMGGLQNALSFTDNIHHLNLHKGLATWQQKTFQSQHKTPAPSMMALQMHTSTGHEWKIKARRRRLMVLPSYSRVTGHWRIYLTGPHVAKKHIRKEEWEICRTLSQSRPTQCVSLSPWSGDRYDWWFSSVYMHVCPTMWWETNWLCDLLCLNIKLSDIYLLEGKKPYQTFSNKISMFLWHWCSWFEMPVG